MRHFDPDRFVASALVFCGPIQTRYLDNFKAMLANTRSLVQNVVQQATMFRDIRMADSEDLPKISEWRRRHTIYARRTISTLEEGAFYGKRYCRMYSRLLVPCWPITRSENKDSLHIILAGMQDSVCTS
jgi:uncharacterized protein (UPF0147 family)